MLKTGIEAICLSLDLSTSTSLSKLFLSCAVLQLPVVSNRCFTLELEGWSGWNIPAVFGVCQNVQRFADGMFCRSICMRAVRENFVWLLCSSVVVWAILCKILRILCPCGPVWWYEWYHLCFKLSSAVLYSYMLADMSQTSSEWHTQHPPPDIIISRWTENHDWASVVDCCIMDTGYIKLCQQLYRGLCDSVTFAGDVWGVLMAGVLTANYMQWFTRSFKVICMIFLGFCNIFLWAVEIGYNQSS